MVRVHDLNSQSLPQQIIQLLTSSPGLTDREITIAIRGLGKPQQPINQAARSLERKGRISRTKRGDGLIGNYLTGAKQNIEPVSSTRTKNHDVDALSEDEIKKVLVDWLNAQGWRSDVAWGRAQGIDIDARRGSERWIIEVKGPGSRPQMRVNYFLGILGETLQRMDDPKARYSISLPDLAQYRGLWDRLPEPAKSRTEISLILVSESGEIEIIG